MMVVTTQVEQVIPLPSHQEVTTYAALPSVSHPSDHIALICDLRWNPWPQWPQTEIKDSYRPGQLLWLAHLGFGIFFFKLAMYVAVDSTKTCSSYYWNIEKNINSRMDKSYISIYQRYEWSAVWLNLHYCIVHSTILKGIMTLGLNSVNSAFCLWLKCKFRLQCIYLFKNTFVLTPLHYLQILPQDK